ncbi:Eukaryotic translation initiation factor 3 subunit B [Spatholobus suberectus]|nr:Eukaryotic translation initiation factor 3 subunit B [Spatholobus suberectus]
MATAEHFMATDVEWDPTGRYVATSVTSVHELENAFNIWTFRGKLLHRILKDHFFQEAVQNFLIMSCVILVLLRSGKSRNDIFSFGFCYGLVL